MTDADCTPSREPRSVAASINMQLEKETVYRVHAEAEFLRFNVIHQKVYYIAFANLLG